MVWIVQRENHDVGYLRLLTDQRLPRGTKVKR